MKAWKLEELEERYGEWVMLGLEGKDRHGNQRALCRCKCGKEKHVRLSHLKSGASKNCGCGRTKNPVGERYGLLVINKTFGTDQKGNQWVECLCDCGNKKKTNLYYLRNGDVKSCGCLVSEANASISSWLAENGYRYEPEYREKECRNKRPLPFDFAVWVDEELRLIEFQGWHHFNELPKRGGAKRLKEAQLHDRIKSDFCEKNGVPLLAIHYVNRRTMFEEIQNFLEN